MEFIFLLMIIALLPAYIASTKGRSMFGWWIYGVLLFIIALPHSLLLSKRTHERDVDTSRRPCPHCAEDIKMQASICPFCKRPVTPVFYP